MLFYLKHKDNRTYTSVFDSVSGRVLAWVITRGKVQRRRRDVSPSPHWCVMCKDCYDCVKHLFFQCVVALLNGFMEFTLVGEILWVLWPCCVKDTSLLEGEKRDWCWAGAL